MAAKAARRSDSLAVSSMAVGSPPAASTCSR